MKFVLSLLMFLLTVHACTPIWFEERNLNIPDKIEVVKTARHQQILGTRLFMVIPPGYKFTETSGTLRKSDGSEILLMDAIGKAFDKNKDIHQAPQNNSTEMTFYQKTFIFGDLCERARTAICRQFNC